MSIEFVLTNELEVWRVDTVNQIREIVQILVPVGGRLELAKRFEQLWKEMDTQGVFDGVDELVFRAGSGAGFTDSRIVYLWLKSAQLFSGVELRIESEQNIDGFYNASPRIG
jgi:hypothetical protein